jgi:hypothetical protein
MRQTPTQSLMQFSSVPPARFISFAPTAPVSRCRIMSLFNPFAMVLFSFAATLQSPTVMVK